MATCLPSRAPRQFGKLHFMVNSWAMEVHSSSVLGIYTYTAMQTVNNLFVILMLLLLPVLVYCLVCVLNCEQR